MIRNERKGKCWKEFRSVLWANPKWQSDINDSSAGNATAQQLQLELMELVGDKVSVEFGSRRNTFW